MFGSRHPGTHVLSFGLCRGSDTRAPCPVLLCESVSSSLGRALSCPRILCCCTQFMFLSAVCIHVMWHVACIFHWLRAFMLSCLDPTHLVTWLLVNLPHLSFLVTLLICSLYNLLVFAVLCQFVIACILSCPVCLVLTSLVKPGCQPVFPYMVVFVCLFYFIIKAHSLALLSPRSIPSPHIADRYYIINYTLCIIHISYEPPISYECSSLLVLVRLCLPFPCVSTPLYGPSCFLSLVHSSPSVFDLLLT